METSGADKDLIGPACAAGTQRVLVSGFRRFRRFRRFRYHPRRAGGRCLLANGMGVVVRRSTSLGRDIFVWRGRPVALRPLVHGRCQRLAATLAAVAVVAGIMMASASATVFASSAAIPRVVRIEPVNRSVPASWDVLQAVACPTTSECVAVNFDTAITFDPRSPSHRRTHHFPNMPADAGVNSITCPSSVQCTVIGNNDRYADVAYTFDPRSGVSIRSLDISGPGEARGAFVEPMCPSTRLCVADGSDNGYPVAAVFDPWQAGDALIRFPGAPQMDGGGVSCPLVTQCVWDLGSPGYVLTFDPAAGW